LAEFSDPVGISRKISIEISHQSLTSQLALNNFNLQACFGFTQISLKEASEISKK
jgi:hypothetical protein